MVVTMDIGDYASRDDTTPITRLVPGELRKIPWSIFMNINANCTNVT